VRVLVTGATGFLGREVTHQLTAVGHEVVALTRGPSTVPGAPQTVRGDLTDLASVRNALAQAGPVEVVCHLAALTQARDSRRDPLRYWDLNTAGTLRILQAVAERSMPVRVILASSGAVYGTGQSSPIPEDAATAPTSPYGRSKAAAEELLSDAAAADLVSGVVLRTFNLAGASRGMPDTDTTRVIPAALAVATGDLDAFAVNGTGEVVREYTHVGDVARAYLAAIERPMPSPFSVYNVGSGHGSSVLDVLDVVRAVTGHAIPVDHRPAQDEPASLIGDVTRAAADLDWTPKHSDLAELVADAWAALHAGASATRMANQNR
jgi:UDP-glucose 4-epimerase